MIGCGIQGRAHVRAIRAVRPITRVLAFDTHAATARRFADDVAREHGIAALACGDLNAATSIADVIVTCTPSRSPFLSTADARPGTFVGAVGADNEHKHEIDPALMAEATVVVDDLDQCATIGDLHHAIAAGTMTATDVRATLAAVVADPARWRPADDEIVVFDSTGVAIEDVAAAAVVLKRAEQDNDGLLLSLGD